MKIICIGRNYVAHARELNNEVPTEPMVFIKPQTALNTTGAMTIPNFTKDLHYELELVLRVGTGGSQIGMEEALDHIDAIALGIDFTARDIQAACKAKGHPWEKAKAFDNAATLSDFKSFGDYKEGAIKFRLFKNGECVQDGDSSLMIFPFDKIISYVSDFFTLEKGDLIYTGTPAGVGPVSPGDMLEGFLGEELLHKVKIN